MSLPCGLKGSQKQFLLHLNEIKSCCSADSEPLTTDLTFQDYIDQWHKESQQLTQGIRLPGCNICWKAEDQGLQSFRNKFQDVTDPDLIEIFQSNLCNQMCSYCSPKYSSMWQDTVVERGVFTQVSKLVRDNMSPIHVQTNNEHWLSEVKEYINHRPDNSVSINLLGGEPLMQLRSLNFYEQLDINKIKKFKITTNLNPPTNKFLHWLLDNIPNHKLQIDISLDATPEFNHIPRAGFDADRFYQNLELVKSKQVPMMFLSVLTVLNLFDLPNYIRWSKLQGATNVFFTVHNPDCLAIKYVPHAVRLAVWSQLDNIECDQTIKDQLLQPEIKVDLKLLEQYNFINQYFERSNLTVDSITNSTFQEYWKWLQQETR
jgi:sulfatase maturation enzyme AslB (radical SAM superfamily)